MSETETRPRRRADAERSIARIVSAARHALSADPQVRTDDIAAAAGVGRMTLYGHFPTRADLVEAALVDALRDGELTLSAVDLAGDPRLALARLLESSWALLAESVALLTAAQSALPPGRIRELHGDPARRVEELLERGREEGVFRSDLPVTWLVSMIHHVLHAAGEEVRAQRVTTDEVGDMIVETVRSMLSTA